MFKREGRTKKKLVKKRQVKDEQHAEHHNSGGRFMSYGQGENNFTINHMYKMESDQQNDSTDRLMEMRNKLLEGRNNNTNTNEERMDFPPYKKLHQANYEESANLSSDQQLQQLDRAIAQNNLLTSKSSVTPMINLQNSTSNITISSTSANYSSNGANVNVTGAPTQFITIAPNSNVYQPQILQPIPGNGEGNQVRYIIANPQNSAPRPQIQTPQPIFVAPNNGGQMQVVFNPSQNQSGFPQQQGFINFVSHYQQPSNGEMMVMMNIPSNQGKQVSYVAPSNGTTMHSQQQYPVIVQAPQFISMMPAPQQVGGYAQVQPQQVGGFTPIQPQPIGGFPTVQPQPVTTFPQQIHEGYPVVQQQPQVVYMLPTGNIVTQNISSSQGFGYTADPNAQISIQVSSNPQQSSMGQKANMMGGSQQPGIIVASHSNDHNETRNESVMNFNKNTAQLSGYLHGIAEKKEYTEPAGATMKKVIFDETQKPRPTSDLLNELKANSSSNMAEKRLGLKVLAHGEKNE